MSHHFCRSEKLNIFRYLIYTIFKVLVDSTAVQYIPICVVEIWCLFGLWLCYNRYTGKDTRVSYVLDQILHWIRKRPHPRQLFDEAFYLQRSFNAGRLSSFRRCNFPVSITITVWVDTSYHKQWNGVCYWHGKAANLCWSLIVEFILCI